MPRCDYNLESIGRGALFRLHRLPPAGLETAARRPGRRRGGKLRAGFYRPEGPPRRPLPGSSA